MKKGPRLGRKKKQQQSFPLNLQVKGLRITHLNKIDDLSVLLQDSNINIPAISEMRLDASVMNSEVDIPGCCIFRLDGDCRGGGVVFCI